MLETTRISNEITQARDFQKIWVAMNNGYTFLFYHPISKAFSHGRDKVALHKAREGLLSEMRAGFSAEVIQSPYQHVLKGLWRTHSMPVCA